MLSSETNTMNPSDRADLFLLPLDPGAVLGRAFEDYSRFVPLDAKLGAAAELLQGQLNGYSAEDQEILATVFWTYMRNRFKGSANVEATMRLVRNGDSFLRAIEESIDTTLAPEVLQELIRRGGQFATVDSAAGAEFQQARAEVQGLDSTHILPLVFAVGFLVGVGAATLYCDTFGC